MKDLIKIYKEESKNVFDSLNEDDIYTLFLMILDTYTQRNSVIVCGNGGNVGYIENMIADFNLHPFTNEDKSSSNTSLKRLSTKSLCSSHAIITAILNDIGPEYIFEEQLKYEGKTGDLLIAITGSGNSKNILKAIEYCNNNNIKVCTITKNKNSACALRADHVILIEGVSVYPGQVGKNNNNFHFEDCLSKITHIISGLLKKVIHDRSQ